MSPFDRIWLSALGQLLNGLASLVRAIRGQRWWCPWIQRRDARHASCSGATAARWASRIGQGGTVVPGSNALNQTRPVQPPVRHGEVRFQKLKDRPRSRITRWRSTGNVCRQTPQIACASAPNSARVPAVAVPFGITSPPWPEPLPMGGLDCAAIRSQRECSRYVLTLEGCLRWEFNHPRTALDSCRGFIRRPRHRGRIRASSTTGPERSRSTRYP